MLIFRSEHERQTKENREEELKLPQQKRLSRVGRTHVGIEKEGLNFLPPKSPLMPVSINLPATSVKQSPAQKSACPLRNHALPRIEEETSSEDEWLSNCKSVEWPYALRPYSFDTEEDSYSTEEILLSACKAQLGRNKINAHQSERHVEPNRAGKFILITG